MLTRTAFKPNLEPRACDGCGKPFVPRNTLQRVCRQSCAINTVEKDKRAKLRARKEAIKTIPDLLREAQHEFNAYIRERDKDKPCVCCGHPLGDSAVGGDYDCGHYRSVGSAAHLRFDERNAHAQRKVCNRWGAGRAVDYRIGLVARLGLVAVEALENDNTPHKWDRAELIEIRATYKAKRKELCST